MGALAVALLGGPAGAEVEEDQPSAEQGPQYVALTPDGLLQDAAGGLLRFPGSRLALVMVGHSFAWRGEQGWVPANPVGEQERQTLRHAVDEFNKIPGLGLTLELVETTAPAYSLGNVWPNRDKLVVYWAVGRPGLGAALRAERAAEFLQGGRDHGRPGSGRAVRLLQR